MYSVYELLWSLLDSVLNDNFDEFWFWLLPDRTVYSNGEKEQGTVESRLENDVLNKHREAKGISNSKSSLTTGLSHITWCLQPLTMENLLDPSQVV